MRPYLKQTSKIRCVCVEYVHVRVGDCRVQERMVDPLKLELWMFVNLLMWVLGTKPGSLPPGLRAS